jgi:hypothetical protein
MNSTPKRCPIVVKKNAKVQTSSCSRSVGKYMFPYGNVGHKRTTKVTLFNGLLQYNVPSNQAATERRRFRVGCGKRRRITGGTSACHAADSSRLAHLSASFPPRSFCVVRLPRRDEVVSVAFTTRITSHFRGGYMPPKHHRYAVRGVTRLRNACNPPRKTLPKRRRSDDDGY